MSRNTLILTTIFLGLGLVIYFWESPEELLSGLNNTGTTQNPPYAIVRNASTRHYNNQGEVDYTFEAEALRHFRDEVVSGNKVSLQNYTEIVHPKLVIFHDGQPWVMEARNGKFTEQNQHLLLWDDVVVSQLMDSGKLTTMETQKLEIKPEEKYAYTQEPVKIKSPSGQINATGMIANFAEKQISLLSQVEGKHDPIL